ncbi:hypothetical protein DL96DRAFT_1816648 [Flagelloscypha sp. PMI_526]|nr:hypothetical protein DL96DRAFT_1816648 [Flagelloscypha sp. PMI_526]
MPSSYGLDSPEGLGFSTSLRVEPFRFRVLSLTWFETGSPRPEFHDLLLSLPPGVLSSSVQRIWMGTFGSQDYEILSRSRGITHLALNNTKQAVPDLTVYPNLQRLSLIHATADHLLHRMRPRPEDKVQLSLSSLTHLQVFGPSIHGLDADWIWDFRRSIHNFPALSHFMLEYVACLHESDWKDLRSLASLNQMKMMVILKCPPSSSWAQEPLDPEFICHSKVVVLDWECLRMRQEWDNSCIGKADAWDRAEGVMRERAERAKG